MTSIIHLFRNTPATRTGVALAVIGLALAGCGGNSKTQAGPATASAAPAASTGGWAGREQTGEAITLLNEGKPTEARKKLITVLNANPGDGIARDLITQIDSDPKVLLGTRSFAYTAKEGDTMSTLAQRYLGNPMRFYALARYNGLVSPTLVPGQSIVIPGKRPAAPVQARKAAPPPAAVKKTAPAIAAAPKPAPAKPMQSSANPGQAARLRGQGLAAMNGGAINRAVALLRQALAFDPGSSIIKGDLARALRIQGTVRGRP